MSDCKHCTHQTNVVRIGNKVTSHMVCCHCGQETEHTMTMPEKCTTYGLNVKDHGPHYPTHRPVW